MTNLMKFLAGGAGIAALATAGAASAQYYSPYAYGYGAVSTQSAENQCTAAVQNRLYTRTGLGGLIGSLFGMSGTSARVLGITDVRPMRTHIRVRGIASSGRQSYNPYGYGYYGALGAGYAPDLQFRCDVDYNGYVRNVDIRRR